MQFEVTLMRIATEVLMTKYKDAVFAAAFALCKNRSDADDAVQECFIRYHCSQKEFDSEQHIRAWLLRVAINCVKSELRQWRRRAAVPLEECMETLIFDAPEDKALFEAVMSIDEKYRIVLHLFYFEDMSVREIGRILSITENNVKVRLSRARAMLKKIIQEDLADDE